MRLKKTIVMLLIFINGLVLCCANDSVESRNVRLKLDSSTYGNVSLDNIKVAISAENTVNYEKWKYAGSRVYESEDSFVIQIKSGATYAVNATYVICRPPLDCGDSADSWQLPADQIVDGLVLMGK